jgi:hypothetical protein
MALPAVPLLVAGAAGAVSSGVQAYEANKSATYAAKVADYNANVDIANAKQQAMNAQANIQSERQQGAELLSKQRASYAASGVLSGTGSALAVQATTAARLEHNIQQYWNEVQQKESQLYTQAGMEVAKGKAEAKAYHLSAAADMFKAVGSMALTFAAPLSGGSSISAATQAKSTALLSSLAV